MVFLMRHGEKAKDDPKDPTLTPEGTARAEATSRMLAKAGITHVFATEYRRTQATVAPLAKALGLTVTNLSSKEPTATADAIRALPPVREATRTKDPGDVAIDAAHRSAAGPARKSSVPVSRPA